MSTFQKKFSFLLSFTITALCSLFFLSHSFFYEKKPDWGFHLLFLILLFLVSYSLISFAGKNFIFGRLSEILESLVYYRNNKDLRKNYPAGEDVIMDIRDEINGWAEDRKNETDRLKKLELYRKEYIGNISHELKTPVFNIQGYIHTLLDGGLEDPKVNREYLARAGKSVERMISMIEDLESISQLEAGELIIEQEKFDIVALAKDVCEGQEMNATGKGIIFSIKNEDPVFVLADRFRIRQVLTNLIVNSIKYGKEYGETTVKVIENNDVIKIEVADNGIGISPEHIPRLFERFYRIDKSRSRDQGGTGLGLAIVKHILEAHGQNIYVTSTPEKGSIFVFTLKKANSI